MLLIALIVAGRLLFRLLLVETTTPSHVPRSLARHISIWHLDVQRHSVRAASFDISNIASFRTAHLPAPREDGLKAQVAFIFQHLFCSSIPSNGSLCIVHRSGRATNEPGKSSSSWLMAHPDAPMFVPLGIKFHRVPRRLRELLGSSH